jgi:hypothetical protein
MALWRAQGECHARSGACMGVSGRHWARRFLPVAVRVLVVAWSGQAQVSERRVIDMVRHAGSDQRGSEQVSGMPCHDMACSGQVELAPVLGR